MNIRNPDPSCSKYFTIHKNDVGSEAYQDEYVKQLESQLATVIAENAQLRERIARLSRDRITQ